MVEDALTGIQPRLPVFWTFSLRPDTGSIPVNIMVPWQHGSHDIHQSAHSTALIRVKIQILGTPQQTGRETQRGTGGRTTDLRASEEDPLRSEPSNPWHTTFYTRSDETQRGNGDRPTDLRTSEEPYSLRSEIGKSLALYLLYEVR